MSIFLEHIKQLSGDSLFPLKLEVIRRSTIATTVQSRILECIVKEEQQEAKVKKVPSAAGECMAAHGSNDLVDDRQCQRGVCCQLSDDTTQHLRASAGGRRAGESTLGTGKAEVPQKARMIRRGIGQPLSRSVACKTWHAEPAVCAHSDDKLRQRAGRGHFWWTCLDCGSRWERLEAQQDRQINAPSSSSHADEAAGSTVTVVNTSSKVAYPKILPAPRYRPDLSDLKLKEEKSPEKSTWPGHVTVREMMINDDRCQSAAGGAFAHEDSGTNPGRISEGRAQEEPAKRGASIRHHQSSLRFAQARRTTRGPM